VLSSSDKDHESSTILKMGGNQVWVIKRLGDIALVSIYNIYNGIVSKSSIGVTDCSYIGDKLIVSAKTKSSGGYMETSTRYEISFSTNGKEASISYTEVNKLNGDLIPGIPKDYAKTTVGKITMSKVSGSTSPPVSTSLPASLSVQNDNYNTKKSVAKVGGVVDLEKNDLAFQSLDVSISFVQLMFEGGKAAEDKQAKIMKESGMMWPVPGKSRVKQVVKREMGGKSIVFAQLQVFEANGNAIKPGEVPMIWVIMQGSYILRNE
jgi:hypothetical protein